jgi:type II secretory pathway predicted ATPase ExeA
LQTRPKTHTQTKTAIRGNGSWGPFFAVIGGVFTEKSMLEKAEASFEQDKTFFLNSIVGNLDF